MEPWSFGEAPLPDGGRAGRRAPRPHRARCSRSSSRRRSSRRWSQTLRDAQQRLAAAGAGGSVARASATRADARPARLRRPRRDVGDYNPCFPRLRARGSSGDGGATAPSSSRSATKARPGIVHGGFLAVFFDCVLQQLNCDLGLAGKTAELVAPLPAPDPVAHAARRARAERVVDGGRIRSHAELLLDDEVLCEADMLARPRATAARSRPCRPRRP